MNDPVMQDLARHINAVEAEDEWDEFIEGELSLLWECIVTVLSANLPKKTNSTVARKLMKDIDLNLDYIKRQIRDAYNPDTT